MVDLEKGVIRTEGESIGSVHPTVAYTVKWSSEVASRRR